MKTTFKFEIGEVVKHKGSETDKFTHVILQQIAIRGSQGIYRRDECRPLDENGMPLSSRIILDETEFTDDVR